MDFAEPKQPIKHAVGIAFVVLLHVAIIYALVTGLGRQAIELIRPPIVAKIIDAAKPPPPELPPPPPVPVAAPPPLPYFPLPEVVIKQKPPPTPKAPVAIVHEPPPPAPAPAAPPQPAPVVAHVPVVVPGDFSAARHCEKPIYPETARRLGIAGKVKVRLLVGPDGRVAEHKIDESSGNDRIDAAVVAALKTCRFVPETVDGKPQEKWVALNYAFNLSD
jgi:periplasmic protein TonB